MSFKPIVTSLPKLKTRHPPQSKAYNASVKGGIRAAQARTNTKPASYWGSYDPERTARERDVTLPKLAWLERR